MSDDPSRAPARSQDDLDTREVRSPARATRNRAYEVLIVIAVGAVCGLVGYTLGRGPQRKRGKPIVLSELDKRKEGDQAPATSTAPKLAAGPALARLESVEALDEPTRVTVRFAAPVARAQAEDPSRYTIDPVVEVSAATLADDARSVALTTSPLKHDVPYRLTVTGIEQLPLAPEDTRVAFRYVGTRRVLDGLIALYTFEEGEGEVVRDRSRFGEPLDLKIVDTDATAWIPGGLAIRQNAHVASDGDATKLTEACRASNALAIEAWLEPANATQGGPSRIVSLSRGAADRNFTLGQEGPNYNIRLRTTERSVNGEPSVSSNGGVAETLTHVVYTRDADGNVTVWINGQPSIAAAVPGDFSNWAAFPFGLANEFDTDRTWLGELHLVALYSRALTPADIARNYQAGPEGRTPKP